MVSKMTQNMTQPSHAGVLPGLQYSWNILVNKEELNSLKKGRVGKNIKKSLNLLKKNRRRRKGSIHSSWKITLKLKKGKKSAPKHLL